MRCVFRRLIVALSACQAEEWVSERRQKMAEDDRADLSNLQAKMKLLQKHQVFEAEILAHDKIISSVLQVRRVKSSRVKTRCRRQNRSNPCVQISNKEVQSET